MNTLERHGVFEVHIWYLAWGMCSGVRGARLMGEGDLSTSLPCSRPRYFLLFPFLPFSRHEGCTFSFPLYHNSVTFVGFDCVDLYLDLSGTCTEAQNADHRSLSYSSSYGSLMAYNVKPMWYVLSLL